MQVLDAPADRREPAGSRRAPSALEPIAVDDDRKVQIASMNGRIRAYRVERAFVREREQIPTAAPIRLFVHSWTEQPDLFDRRIVLPQRVDIHAELLGKLGGLR